MSQLEAAQDRLIATYRKKARRYDYVSRLYPAPGYPQRSQRRRAVQALRLGPGACVVDMACGTGLNFAAIQDVIGPAGRIVGVDLTDAMLARAQQRVDAQAWSNVSLVQADAAHFVFPSGVDAILCTYALSQVPESPGVIAAGAAALSGHGRWVVLDLKVPGRAPRWATHLGRSVVRPFASIDDWVMRRPWETIRAAMAQHLGDVSWEELCFGSAFLAAGSRCDGTRAA